jgi:hypothetical protein
MKPSKLFGSTFLWLLVSAVSAFNANAQGPTGQIIQGPTGQIIQGPTGQIIQGPTGQIIQGPTGQVITGEPRFGEPSIGSTCGSNIFTDNIEPIRLEFHSGARLKLTNNAGVVRISNGPVTKYLSKQRKGFPFLLAPRHGKRLSSF